MLATRGQHKADVIIHVEEPTKVSNKLSSQMNPKRKAKSAYFTSLRWYPNLTYFHETWPVG